MNVDGFVHAVAEDLGQLASLGDEATTRAAVLLSTALDASLRRRLQELLSEAALELSSQLEPGHVEVRISGPDLQLVHVEGPAEEAPTGGDELLSARITLRLPERLKAHLESSANGAGVSLNTFLIQALGRVGEPRRRSVPPGPSGGRLTGYGRG